MARFTALFTTLLLLSATNISLAAENDEFGITAHEAVHRTCHFKLCPL